MPTSQHAKVFWKTAISFGTAMSVMQLAQGHLVAALISGVAGGLLFGLAMAWMNQRGERRLARQGITATNMDPIQERTVEFDAPADLAFEASRLALLSIPKVKISRVDRDGRAIDAKVGMSIHSFGEILKVRVVENGNRASRVSIRSEPRMKTATMDYGKGVENVEMVLSQLRSKLQNRARSPL